MAGARGVRCMLMRGGTSKGAYFLAEDLPADPAARDDLLLRIMGSPDARQIDGIGGAHPLTSKVAVISESVRPDADVDYLFLQVGVDQATVSDRQNCGNLLAGVGPFAVERGLAGGLAGADPHGQLGQRGHRELRGTPTASSTTTATPRSPGCRARPRRSCSTSPGPRARSPARCCPPAMSPTSSRASTVTCIDNGMPVVVVPAVRFGRSGYETVAELEADTALGERIQALRLAAGQLMGLGDVSAASVPKVSLVASPADGGTICTRTFIPVRVHDAIGVLGAVSVATALLLDGAAGGGLAEVKPGQTRFDIEHPTGHLEVEAEVDQASQPATVIRSGVVRTARKLFDGTVFPRRSR